MERLIQINDGVIGGFEKELIEKILPSLSDSFKQRKQFWEYYFNEKIINLTLEDIENISKEFAIELCESTLFMMSPKTQNHKLSHGTQYSRSILLYLTQPMPTYLNKQYYNGMIQLAA